ncbi:MAG: flagellar filament capping protein FliD, partial [Huintestinicola sp.]
MSTTHEVTRMAGLMSGLDVESLVKAGTQSTKNSLDSKKQKLQTLQWKQEAYRDIIKAMNAFQSKYLDISSSSSIRANAVMKSNKATSSDSSLIVTAGSSAAAKDYTITSVKSAQAATVGGSRVSSGEVTLDFSRASEGENKVSVTLDGSARNITFTGGATAEESKQNFLDALNKSFGEISAAKFSFKDGTNKLTIENAPDDKVSHIFTVGYSDSVGLKNDASNMISTKATLGSIDFKTPLSPSGTYDFSINGKSFSFKSTTTVKDMMNEINRSDAGVKISFNELSQSFEMKSSQTGAGQQIKLEQKNGNLLNSLFNIDSDSLSVSPTSAKLVEKNISADTEFKFTAKAGGIASGDSISVNGVKLGITGLTQTQKTEKITVNGQDDVDAQLYTDKNGDTIYKYTQDNVVHYATKGDDGSFTDIATKENSTVTINGKQVEDLEGKTADAYINSQLGLEKQLNAKTSEQYEKALNDAYKNAVPDGKGSFSVTIENDEAKISFTPGADELTKITVSGDVAAEGSADGTIANYTETPYSADKVFSDKTSFELLVDNKDIVTINGTGEDGKVTVQDLVDSGLFNYNEADGTLTVAGKKQIDAGYGDAVFDFYNAFGTAKLVGEESSGSYSVHGSNAQMTINGVTLESASNSFTVEGTTFSVGNVKDFDQNDIDSGKAEAITVGVTKDTSRIKETIKEFMTSYNALLDTVNKALNTSRPKSSSGDYY